MKKVIFTIASVGLLILSLNSCGSSSEDEGESTIYVNSQAQGKSDGTSWTNAFTDLNSALASAEEGDEIFVASGTYYPSQNGDTSASFEMVDGVSVYGGFNGTEASLQERDYEKNPTVLSGDIGEKGNAYDNSTKVVIAANNVIDGFTITGGTFNRATSDVSLITNTGTEIDQASVSKAEGHTDPGSVSSGTAEESSSGNGIIIWKKAPTIKNCIITGNSGGKGAGVYIMGAEEEGKIPTFINTIISDNIASGRGGGVAMDYYSTAYFIDCTFDNNECTSGKGGAIYNDFSGNPLLENCLFINNYAQSGAAIANDGVSCPVILDSTFYNNTADEAGACIYQGTGPYNDPLVENTVMWDNFCEQDKIDVYNYNECSPNITYSDIQQGYEGTGNFSEDPLFVNPDGGDFTYLENSPAINAGSNGETIGYSLQEKEEREENEYDSIMDTLSGKYENNTTEVTPLDISNDYAVDEENIIDNVIYVDGDLAMSGDGTSWNSAMNDLQFAIDLANAIYVDEGKTIEVWVKKGTYYPGTERSDSFIMREGVYLYGGFDGSESSLEARDYKDNETILSGNIGSKEDDTDNCYHVLIGGDDTALDGFTVSGGYADGVGGELYDNKGGALLNYLAGERVIPSYEPTLGFDPYIANCIFEDNYAEEGGAAYTYHGGNPEFVNVTFRNNKASYGAATLDRAGTNSKYTECIFENNEANYKGGANFTDYGAMASFYDCTFDSNYARTEGGAIYTIDRASQASANETSFYLVDPSWEDLEDIYSTVYVNTCDFSNNTAGNHGGAMYIYDSSYAKIVASTFDGNSSLDAAIVASYSATVILDSLTNFTNNDPTKYTTEGTGATIVFD